jgi:carbonic anhydrase/acetyltransferase-like protein (isoleucine patch superfamily)
LSVYRILYDCEFLVNDFAGLSFYRARKFAFGGANMVKLYIISEGEYEKRMPIYEFEGQRPQIAATAFIHPQAVVIGRVEIGANCYIGAGAVLRGDHGHIVIGDGSNVQDLACLHTERGTLLKIGCNSSIAHGATVHGPSLIGNDVTVGMGAVVSARCEIGDDCMLGSGGILPPRKTIPPHKVLMGNPAVVVKDMTEAVAATIKGSAETYQSLARRSRESMREIKLTN